MEALKRFLEGPDAVLICTHATLRFAHDALDEDAFNDMLARDRRVPPRLGGRGQPAWRAVRSIMMQDTTRTSSR